MSEIGLVASMGQVITVPHNVKIEARASEFARLHTGLNRVPFIKEILAPQIHKELSKVQQMISTKKEISIQELLLYQTRFNQFHLRVELISKLGESIAASVRRFEQHGG